MTPSLTAVPCLALALLTGTALLARPAAAQVSITANITGTAPDAQANADIQNALNFLASDFSSTTPFSMTADIAWQDLGSTTLGESITGSSSYQAVNGVLYANPLDRFLFGSTSTVDTSGNYADFTIDLNNNPATVWDYTLNTPANFNSYSLADVVYHESLHSMGFTAGNNADGSYAFTDANGNPLPTVWDTMMYDGTTQQAFTADTQAQRAAALVSGENPTQPGSLLFVGPNAEAVNPNEGQPVSLYAPTTFEDGSSDGSHISPNQQGAGLLYPALYNGVYLTPTPLELAMMDDIGWNAPISSGGITPPAQSPGAAVPEVSSFALLGLGLLPIGLLARRRRQSA